MNMKMKRRHNYRRLSLEEKLKVLADYNAGMKIMEITHKHKIALTTLYDILKYLEKNDIDKNTKSL